MALETHHHYHREPVAGHIPYFIVFHGTGGNERDLVPLADQVVPGAGILGIRGNVLEHGMPRYFRRLREGIFDLADLKARTAELYAFLEEACPHYGIAREQSVAVGYSNGANIISSLLFTYPGVFKRSVLLRGMVPFRPEQTPDLSGTAVLMINGSGDPIIPSEEVHELVSLFNDSGTDLQNEWLHTGHQLVASDLELMKRWLKKDSDPTGTRTQI